tara:strand:+ start:4404 stop:4511 length:108 start_codon:yes stop_codon:yes gene_type:complete
MTEAYKTTKSLNKLVGLDPENDLGHAELVSASLWR